MRRPWWTKSSACVDFHETEVSHKMNNGYRIAQYPAQRYPSYVQYTSFLVHSADILPPTSYRPIIVAHHYIRD